MTSRPIHSPILLSSSLLFVQFNSVRLYSFPRRPTIDGSPCLSHTARPGPPPFTHTNTHTHSSAAAMVMREGTSKGEGWREQKEKGRSFSCNSITSGPVFFFFLQMENPSTSFSSSLLSVSHPVPFVLPLP